MVTDKKWTKKDVQEWFGNRGCFLSPRHIKLHFFDQWNFYVVIQGSDQYPDTDSGRVDVLSAYADIWEINECIGIEEFEEFRTETMIRAKSENAAYEKWLKAQAGNLTGETNAPLRQYLREKLIFDVQLMKVDVKSISTEDLLKDALRANNEVRTEIARRNNVPELETRTATNTDPTDLAHIQFNYVLHKLANYDRKLVKFAKRSGVESAVEIAHERILNEVATAYPLLAATCAEQTERNNRNLSRGLGSKLGFE